MTVPQFPNCPIQEVYGYPPPCPLVHPTWSLSTNSCFCSLFPACGSGLAQRLHTPQWSAVPGFGLFLPHEPHVAAKIIFPRPKLVNNFHSLSLHFLQAGVPVLGGIASSSCSGAIFPSCLVSGHASGECAMSFPPPCLCRGCLFY